MTARKRKGLPKIPREKLTVRIEFWELESLAFQHLSADATRTYVFIRHRYNGSNNGRVPFSHRDAQKALHSDWRRAGNALAELVHFGFTKCRLNGKPGPNIRLASEWELTVFPCGGREATKDFTRWQGEVFEPPYRSRATDSKKQLPTGNGPTPRRQRADAYPESKTSKAPQNGQSVGNGPTESMMRRRQHADTCRYTTKTGPLRPWRAPSYREIPIPSPRARIRTRSCKSASASKKAISPKTRAPWNSAIFWPASPRRAANLTQRQLAERAGLSRGFIASLEQGLREPGPDARAAIERGLNRDETHGTC